MKFVILWIFAVYAFLSAGRQINIALHAQVPPGEKVVGSVITTSGLRNAFLKNVHVNTTNIFYPFSYVGLYDISWDLVLIEGWFPSIEKFIQLCRILNPRVVVMFLCLDPTYPGLKIIENLDVNAYLTNSMRMLEVLSARMPTRHVLLAADPEVMKPKFVKRDHGAVFIGAGGPMLRYKPQLLAVLWAALPHNLVLHGYGWDLLDTDEPELTRKLIALNGVWKGILGQDNISTAYSAADSVIAVTIQSQAEWGMINNRIFEALSCGSIVISTKEAALENEFGDLILYVAPDGAGISEHLNWIKENPGLAEEKRIKARQLILDKHTWSHRADQIIEFYEELSSQYNTIVDCFGIKCSGKVIRSGAPKLVWLVSDELLHHPDYLILSLSLRQYLEGKRGFDAQFNVEMFSYSEVLNEVKKNGSNWFEKFEFGIVFSTPFDALDLLVRVVSVANYTWSEVDKTWICSGKFDRRMYQKWAYYLIGFNPLLVTTYLKYLFSSLVDLQRSNVISLSDELSLSLLNLSTAIEINQIIPQISEFYDLVMYRSMFDLRFFTNFMTYLENKLENGFSIYRTPIDGLRIEHVFGSYSEDVVFSDLDIRGFVNDDVNNIVICELTDEANLCDVNVDRKATHWVLIGGNSMIDWVKRNESVLSRVFSAWDDKDDFVSSVLNSDFIDIGSMLNRRVLWIPSAGLNSSSTSILIAIASIWLNKSKSILVASRTLLESSINDTFLVFEKSLTEILEYSWKMNTAQQIAWQLLGSNEDSHTHLVYYNGFLTAISGIVPSSGLLGADFIADWTENNLKTNMKNAVLRFIGFPKTSGALSTAIVFPANNTIFTVPLNPILLAKESRVYMTLLLFVQHSQSTFGFDTYGFIPGLDGQLCIKHAGNNIGCIIRPFPYLAMDVSVYSEQFNCERQFQLDFTVELLGIGLADAIRSIPYSYVLHPVCTDGEHVAWLSAQQKIEKIAMYMNVSPREIDPLELFAMTLNVG